MRLGEPIYFTCSITLSSACCERVKYRLSIMGVYQVKYNVELKPMAPMDTPGSPSAEKQCLAPKFVWGVKSDSIKVPL